MQRDRNNERQGGTIRIGRGRRCTTQNNIYTGTSENPENQGVKAREGTHIAQEPITSFTKKEKREVWGKKKTSRESGVRERSRERIRGTVGGRPREER